uniref:Uncharacterized protein n=1 Tax=Capra hircus TaxID=9925 RepID=A0A8C2PD12_CAPHI
AGQPFRKFPPLFDRVLAERRTAETSGEIQPVTGQVGNTVLLPGDVSLTHGSGRSPGGGHGNSLQSSCLENPIDREAWWVTVHRVAKSRTELKQTRTRDEVRIQFT